MRVALAQFDVKIGNVNANLAIAGKYVELAAGRGANLIVLPELWSSGYELEHCRDHSRISKEKVLPALATLARRFRIYIAGSVLKANVRGEVFNSAILLDPRSRSIRAYDKVHLFGPMQEDQFLTPGCRTPIFHLPIGDLAMAICYDLRFPELFRKYALMGVPLVILCAQWPAIRLEHWRTLVRARAIENQYFVAACNRVGESEGTKFGGHSMIVGPWGDVLCEGAEKSALLTSDINFQAVKESRARIPSLKDRRPRVY